MVTGMKLRADKKFSVENCSALIRTIDENIKNKKIVQNKLVDATNRLIEAVKGFHKLPEYSAFHRRILLWMRNHPDEATKHMRSGTYEKLVEALVEFLPSLKDEFFEDDIGSSDDIVEDAGQYDALINTLAGYYQSWRYAAVNQDFFINSLIEIFKGKDGRLYLRDRISYHVGSQKLYLLHFEDIGPVEIINESQIRVCLLNTKSGLAKTYLMNLCVANDKVAVMSGTVQGSIYVDRRIDFSCSLFCEQIPPDNSDALDGLLQGMSGLKKASLLSLDLSKRLKLSGKKVILH